MAVRRYARLYRSASFSAKIMIVAGVAVCVTLVFLLLFSRFLTPYDPYEFTPDRLSPPSWNHIMGTDRLGRDTFSRVITGTYWSLTIAFVSVISSLAVGSFLGAVSGYMGGRVDTVLSLIMDAIWIFPTFVLALVVALVMGPGLINTAIAVAVVALPVFFRVIRSQTLAIRDQAFVEAERLINAKPLYIIRRHIAPFYVSSLIVLTSLRVARAILTVSGLGFLGLGIPPPIPEWGTELAFGRLEIASGAWWLSVFPGFFIFLSILGFNVLGEGLEEILRPVTVTNR